MLKRLKCETNNNRPKTKNRKNYKKIQRKNLLTKITLDKINNLIDTNATNEEIYQWLEEYDNILFGIEYHLNIIEEKSN